MPLDGWAWEQIAALRTHPTIAMSEREAQIFFDARCARGWRDAKGIEVARSMPALMADMRRWKRGEAQRQAGGVYERNGSRVSDREEKLRRGAEAATL